MCKSKWPDVKEKLTLVQGWARSGLNDEQIAANLGIALATYYDYKNKYVEFSEAIKKGKEVIDFEVENALYKRATGYKYIETTKELTEDGFEVTKEVVKEVAPDPTAMIFWLKNRKPKDWRDKQDLELSGEVTTIKVKKPSFEGGEDV
jgi:hypothetical protein